jgi:hypothetical protein
VSLGECVYRAISSKDWINGNKQVKAPAFRRRWQYNENGEAREVWDDDGLSFGTSPADACRHLKVNFGIVKLSTELMRARGFEFDEPSEGQVHVTNMPFYRQEDRELANIKTLQMCECVVEYIEAETTSPTT